MGAGEDPGQGAGRARAKIGSNDPRALRTRQKLVAAFHAAVADADPSAMSVASLTRAAGVNRTSFYSHFDSIKKGVIDMRDLLYFAMLIGLFLVATGVTLELRKAD